MQGNMHAQGVLLREEGGLRKMVIRRKYMPSSNIDLDPQPNKSV